MKKIATDITACIGNTPLVKLSHLSAAHGLEIPIVAKIEARNPGGSVKDRIALGMIEDAERQGTLKVGGTIIEPTSGNTGIGLAMVAAVRGYRMILVMPETMSVERRKLAQGYGAEIVLTPGSQGMKGAIAKAHELLAEIPGSVTMGQFDNPANPATHYATTADEIWLDTGGEIDIFVAGVGTGGTVSGVGRRLKELNPAIGIIAAEPASSPVLKGEAPGPHAIQGIGAGFVPENYDAGVVDDMVDVSDKDAILAAREVARCEGILVGISSGAALFAALATAKEPTNRSKTIVVLLPDTGERYLSTPLFDFDQFTE
jgi:cysteine synthase A